ncbi:hypothetical protein ERICI_02608 [Paenibacillus larvae subsp. larvae]|uniref:Uncharacterized protein n=1 Tax=Paenibacillus larvae subsp. larvae TaxID=147375 RepID=A0A2L1TP16_9BACL|nr:hypothetical protein ERICI_02608 [Paenibacillus larvae subsp. larvae]AVF26761.1 hypothetical protein ERICIII_02625 [Paenibacillus larvae subsp. larvae]AVF31508.1 hypothetical protein ERICIV_02614 [Paenibacillus larvae subsp. larvae]AVG12382.1 hypothetical protein ERICII_02012 [Paenibacillus larvae subsp. larvae DSM 25430]
MMKPLIHVMKIVMSILFLGASADVVNEQDHLVQS